MLSLVRQARRRLLHNELFAQGANAFSAILVAFLVLLVLGTELLSWQWLLPIPAAAVAVGLYLAWRRLPSPYGAARLVDRRLSLSDTLSTAFYFSHNQHPQVSTEARRSVCRSADRLAESLGASQAVRQAVPYRLPRTIYAAMALGLVTASLFGLRYGLSRTLDLKLPLARMLEQQFGFEPKKEQAKKVRRSLFNLFEPQDTSDAAMADPNSNPGGQPEDMNDDSAGASQEFAAQPNNANKQDAGEQADDFVADDDTMEAEAEPQDNAVGGADGLGRPGGSRSDQAQPSSSQQDANGSGESSLLDKVKDAVENLLSRLKPPASPGAQQQSADQTPNPQAGKGQPSGKMQASKDGKNAGDSAADSQDSQNGEMSENGPEQQGTGTGKNDSQNKQAGSGAGNQEGDKNIKQAAQLAAMGKISEILGKRSANVTGEATIEVEATSQQLRTAYTARDAQHSQSGAEINRDEIPVALQPFVEQYFEQVRKQAPPPANNQR